MLFDNVLASSDIYLRLKPIYRGILDLQEAMWKRIEQEDGQAILSDLIRESEDIFHNHPRAILEQDLSWITANTQDNRYLPIIYICRHGREMLGYTPFVLESSSIPFTLGEVTCATYSVRQLTMYGDPVIKTEIEAGLKQDLALDLFDKVRSHIAPRQILLLLCVPSQGTLYKILKAKTTLTKQFHIMQYAANYKRRLIALPKTFEEYLKQLGSKTRSDLNRNSRKLREHVNNELAIKSYTGEPSVTEFMRLAELVSKKTYQWNLLNRGLRDSDHVKNKLLLAAKRGWMRCYILFCREKPVAFMVGYLHRGRYYSTDIGYDPEWAAWSVGNVLHCEVVRDLIERTSDAALFDFMGDRPTHERLSNGVFEEEANFYLFPKSLEGTALYLALLLTDKLSILASRILETLHLKTRVRNLIRQLSTTDH